MNGDVSAVIRILQSRRFPLTSERATQESIAAALDDAGLPFLREHRLGSAGIVDFFGQGIAIEVKLGGAGSPGGSPRDIYRQCKRYVEHPDVNVLVLATGRAGAMPWLGKPVHIVSLGRAWL